MIDVTVKQEKTVRILRKVVGKIDPVTRKNVEQGVDDLVTVLKGEVQKLTPVSSGVLRNKMNAEVRWEGVELLGIVNNPLIYARPIEMGRTSNKPPPSEELRAWCLKTLGDANLAFVVARAIGRRGGFIKVKPYGDRAQMFADAFDQNLGMIERELNKIGIEVSQAVEYLFGE